ncbi:ATPase [Paenibacillus psychroresistens]|uniref:ATPase n=1 Tax=Paenibacillus psychroresistens TaxID=1778678 RepID=A0A6B8RE90_9BACL|nr:ATPase [Paenibacillus psychroresistens]QGQ94490.1 ATPase [Paenibacillus psychroresistens]
MLPLGQKVIIVADSFEQNLTIGDHGYIIAYDRNVDNAFDYVVRIPKMNKHIFLPSADIELEEVLISLEASRIEREALIDYALATNNAELFHRVMNGEEIEPAAEMNNDTVPQDDFVRQVNLKAWI